MRMALQVEVIDLEPWRNRHDRLAVEQHRAKRRLLGLDILRQLRVSHCSAFPEITHICPRFIDR
jgi:hypothetical protein